MYEQERMPREYYLDERRDRDRRREYERTTYEAEYDVRYRERDVRDDLRLREKVKERDVRYNREHPQPPPQPPPPKVHRDIVVPREYAREVRDPMREREIRDIRGEYVEYHEDEARASRREKRHKHKKSKRKRKHSKDRNVEPRRSLVDYEVISSDPDSEAFSRSPVSGRVSPEAAHVRTSQKSSSPSTAIKEYQKRLVERSHSNSPAVRGNSRHSSPSRNSRPFVSRPATPPAPSDRIARVDTARAEAPKAYADPQRAYKGSPTRPPSPKKSRHRSPSPYSRKKATSPHR